MFARTTAAIVLALVAAYGLTKAWPLLAGPSIRLEPEVIDQTGTLTLSGRALRTETLLLNGAILLIDEEGYFSKDLSLPSGGAILSLTATDRFGRHDRETRTVLVP